MKYISMEFRRSLFSLNFWVGILGVSLAHFISIHKVVENVISVYNTYQCAVYFTPYIISLIFCVLPFGLSFCEDMENNFIQQIVLGKNLKMYVFSKVIIIYITSCLAMVLGTILFVFIINIKAPWICEIDKLDNDLLAKMFILKGYPMIYFVIKAFYSGIISSVISLVAAVLSLFWQTRMFVLSIPFIVYCILLYYVKDVFKLDIRELFNPVYGKNNMIISFLLSIGITILLGGYVYLKLWRQYNEKGI